VSDISDKCGLIQSLQFLKLLTAYHHFLTNYKLYQIDEKTKKRKSIERVKWVKDTSILTFSNSFIQEIISGKIAIAEIKLNL
jgi:hypothetical protein